MGVGNTCIKDDPWTPTPARFIKPHQLFKYNIGDHLDCTFPFHVIALHLSMVSNSKIRPCRICAQGYKKVFIPYEKRCRSRPPAHVKPKAPSINTLYNYEFSRTACGEDEVSHATPQRSPPPAVNPFGFSDYTPDDYYDHLQPQYNLPHMSHCEKDSRIKTIVDNMHPLAIHRSATNKCLLRFFIHLKNELRYDAANHVEMSALRRLNRDTPSDMIQDMMRYEDSKNFLMFQLAPDCNLMTLERELASITPEAGEQPAAFLSKSKQKILQMSNNWPTPSPKLIASSMPPKPKSELQTAPSL
uniref:Uncharacterized protein n=1 Tax=Romanomermis culicivorax TaxID=13658 RepID=A0A915IJU0_ROMCU